MTRRTYEPGSQVGEDKQRAVRHSDKLSADFEGIYFVESGTSHASLPFPPPAFSSFCSLPWSSQVTAGKGALMVDGIEEVKEEEKEEEEE